MRSMPELPATIVTPLRILTSKSAIEAGQLTLLVCAMISTSCMSDTLKSKVKNGKFYGRCAIHDDLYEVLEKLRDANAIITDGVYLYDECA